MVTRFVVFARRTLFLCGKENTIHGIICRLTKGKKVWSLITLHWRNRVNHTRSSMVGTQCRSALIFGGLFSQFPNETDSH